MFGHQDDQPVEQNDQALPSATVTDEPKDAPDTQTNLSEESMGSSSSSDLTMSPGLKPTPGSQSQHPGAPLTDTKAEKDKDDVISPAGGYPKALSPKDDIISRPHLSGSNDDQLTDATDEGLVEIKQKALDQLFPLIDKLDQNSEEHFKTLMMIIQASDNHTLIEKAYQVAQTIDDEKARAQALLDIVNEINYFTQQPEI